MGHDESERQVLQQEERKTEDKVKSSAMTQKVKLLLPLPKLLHLGWLESIEEHRQIHVSAGENHPDALPRQRRLAPEKRRSDRLGWRFIA